MAVNRARAKYLEFVSIRKRRWEQVQGNIAGQIAINQQGDSHGYPMVRSGVASLRLRHMTHHVGWSPERSRQRTHVRSDKGAAILSCSFEFV